MQTDWIKFERKKDPRLRNKGKYGMDTRIVWFVVETKDEQDRLSTEYPGRIILCDRTFVLDTHSGKAVENTKKIDTSCSKWQCS